jgi:hypothetical protein
MVGAAASPKTAAGGAVGEVAPRPRLRLLTQIPDALVGGEVADAAAGARTGSANVVALTGVSRGGRAAGAEVATS